jgi:hypothetical protein
MDCPDPRREGAAIANYVLANSMQTVVYSRRRIIDFRSRRRFAWDPLEVERSKIRLPIEAPALRARWQRASGESIRVRSASGEGAETDGAKCEVPGQLTFPRRTRYQLELSSFPASTWSSSAASWPGSRPSSGKRSRTSQSGSSSRRASAAEHRKEERDDDSDSEPRPRRRRAAVARADAAGLGRRRADSYRRP